MSFIVCGPPPPSAPGGHWTRIITGMISTGIVRRFAPLLKHFVEMIFIFFEVASREHQRPEGERECTKTKEVTGTSVILFQLTDEAT
jgi:hypothetical protein